MLVWWIRVVSTLASLNNFVSLVYRGGTSNQFPAVYGDGIFPQLSTIVVRYSTPDDNEGQINTRLDSVRKIIEHIFSFHKNTFTLFLIPDRFCLLISGVKSSRLIFNSFFIKMFRLSKRNSKRFKSETSYPRIIYSSGWRCKTSSSHQWCNVRGYL